ncbi:MAG: hypothetical protein AAFW98_20660 [Pseudomonadota bacterium]
MRAETNVPAAMEAPIVVVGGTAKHEGWIAEHEPAIRRLARASSVWADEVAPPNSAQTVVGDVVVCLPLEGLVDLGAERARLTKELTRLDKDIEKIEGRLSNPKFLEKAEADTVEEQRQKREDATARRAKLVAALGRLNPAA